MVVQSKHDPPLAFSLRGMAKADLIHALDVLRGMPPRLRRYLRDYPAGDTAPMPAPPSDNDIIVLLDAGFLTSKGTEHHLTSLGELARAEIWAAEQYVARLYLENLS